MQQFPYFYFDVIVIVLFLRVKFMVRFDDFVFGNVVHLFEDLDKLFRLGTWTYGESYHAACWGAYDAFDIDVLVDVFEGFVSANVGETLDTSALKSKMKVLFLFLFNDTIVLGLDVRVLELELFQMRLFDKLLDSRSVEDSIKHSNSVNNANK